MINRCEICQKECSGFLGLCSHIKIHKISTKEYYDIYLKKDNENKCYCGKETRFIGLGGGYHKFCSNRCAQKSLEIQEKKRHTNLKNCGYDHFMKTKEGREQSRQRYIENSDKLKEMIRKREETCLRKFSKKHPSQTKEVVIKFKQTLKQKNIQNPARLQEIREKKAKTKQKHYIENSNFFKEIQKKRNKTILIKNIKNPNRLKEIYEKRVKTNIIKYYTKHWAQSEQGREFHRKNMKEIVERGLRDNKKFAPRKGKNENLVFSKIQLYILCQ